MQNNKLWGSLCVVRLLLTIALCALLLLCGCTAPEVKPLIPTTPKQALIDTVLKTDWVVSLAIVGFAISVAAFINGSRMAVGTAVGCGVALVLQLTIVRYAAVITWLGLVLSTGLLLYTFYIKHRAFKEVILGVQDFKDHHPPLKEYLGKQSDTTKKIVKQIKKASKNNESVI